MSENSGLAANLPLNKYRHCERSFRILLTPLTYVHVGEASSQWQMPLFHLFTANCLLMTANFFSNVSILQKNHKNGAFLVKLNMLQMRKIR